MTSTTLTKALVASVAVVGLSAGAYYVMASRKSRTKKAHQNIVLLSKAELIVVLKDLLSEFHGAFIEMANMVQRLHKLGALRGPNGPMESDEIAEFLMHQGMQAKLDAAQARVLANHNVDQSQIEAAQNQYASDLEVAELVEGFAAMYAEAASGIAPILPGLTIPDHLTEDKALEILNELNQERADGFRRALAEFWASEEGHKLAESSEAMRAPPPALAQALQSVHDETEIIVMERHSTIVGNKAVFDSAVALYTRSSDGSFAKEKMRMERAHQVEIVNLMRKRDAKDVPRLEPVRGLSSHLICSDEGDMAHQILEAAEQRIPVVTALVRNLDNVKGALEPLSCAIEDGTLAELVERNTIFLYMPAHDDIPIANRPEYKDVEVCYIFFPRPDKQQRPIACFSLQELIDASTIDLSIYEGPGAPVFEDPANSSVEL